MASEAFLSWPLIHGSSWSGLIKVGPGINWYFINMIMFPSRSAPRHEATLFRLHRRQLKPNKHISYNVRLLRTISQWTSFCVLMMIQYIYKQSSAVITRSNIVRYYIDNYKSWVGISIRCWIHKYHPIPRPKGWAMGCFCDYSWEKWPRYNGTTLYVNIGAAAVGFAHIWFIWPNVKVVLKWQSPNWLYQNYVQMIYCILLKWSSDCVAIVTEKSCFTIIFPWWWSVRTAYITS